MTNLYEDTKEYIGPKLTRSFRIRIEKCVVNLYLKLGIKHFPVDPFDIAKKLNIRIVSYSTLQLGDLALLNTVSADGVSGRNLDGKYTIIYNERKQTFDRHRFTIMHEIGHIVLGHNQNSDFAEICANYFASYALAPFPLIQLFGCKSEMDIVLIFRVSKECAYIIFDRYNRWLNACKELNQHEIILIKQFNNL